MEKCRLPLWSNKDWAVWRRGYCIPVCMVYQWLSFVERCRLFTCLYSLQRTELLGEMLTGLCIPVCMVYQGLSCKEKCRLYTCLYGRPRTELCVKVQAVCTCLYATKDRAVWRSVDCIPFYVCMFYRGLSCRLYCVQYICQYGLPWAELYREG